jgi:hypothetical protein
LLMSGYQRYHDDTTPEGTSVMPSIVHVSPRYLSI